MRRSSVAIAAVALLSGITALGCGRHDSDVGTVRLALTTPNGYAIDQLTYTVYRLSTEILSPTTIDVSDPNAALSLDIALPPSTGVSIRLSAYSADGHHFFLGTSSEFNIVSGQTTLVEVTLRDALGTPAPAPGKLIVDGVIVASDALPVIASVVVAPAQTSAGASVAVSVVASDVDVGDTLSYLWSTDNANGTFASATSASTTYTGLQTGTHRLSVKVIDSHGAAASVAGLRVNFTFTPPGGPPSALELAERALADGRDLELLRAKHPDFDNFPPDPGWGPATLPSQQQYDACVALIRRIAALLPNSARNAANTGPYVPGNDINVFNALLNLNANPIDLFTATNLAPRGGTAWDAYVVGVVADTFAPAPDLTYLHGLPAGSTDAAFGAYISGKGTDSQGVVGLSTNIVKFALLHGLEAELRAF